jgi:hypothetical protein
MATKKDPVHIKANTTSPADKRFKNKLAKEVEKLSPTQQKAYGKAFEGHGGDKDLRVNYQEAHDKGMEAARKVK